MDYIDVVLYYDTQSTSVKRENSPPTSPMCSTHLGAVTLDEDVCLTVVHRRVHVLVGSKSQNNLEILEKIFGVYFPAAISVHWPSPASYQQKNNRRDRVQNAELLQCCAHANRQMDMHLTLAQLPSRAETLQTSRNIPGKGCTMLLYSETRSVYQASSKSQFIWFLLLIQGENLALFRVHIRDWFHFKVFWCLKIESPAPSFSGVAPLHL